jgi:hypothetical protein
MCKQAGSHSEQQINMKRARKAYEESQAGKKSFAVEVSI